VPIPEPDISQLATGAGDPTRRVESLEFITHQLRDINGRVTRLVREYEAVPSAIHDKYDDELFRIVDVDPEIEHTSVGLNPHAIVEDSRGKVKVLIVDYDKLCMNREGVLQSLRNWFEENQARSAMLAEEEQELEATAPPPATSVESLLSSAADAKNRLGDLHSSVVSKLRGASKGGRGQAEKGETAKLEAAFKEERTRYEALIKQQTRDLSSTVERLRQAESRCTQMQKVMDK
jgi:hypothetical protein